ncbi:MAG: hypothetical protein ACOCSP_02530 [archaeon]
MTHRRIRWAIYLAPLVLPWVVVSWGTGHYTVFSLGWIDPGFRVASILTYFDRGAVGFGIRRFTVAYPVALVLYLLALILVLRRPMVDRGSGIVTTLLLLSGLNVGFYAYGTHQQGLVTIPLGTVWLWIAAATEYREYVKTAA